MEQETSLSTGKKRESRLYRWVFHMVCIISLIAVFISGFLGLWVVFVWVLLPLGIIAGIAREGRENDFSFLVAGIIFVIAAPKVGSASLAIPLFGQVLSSLIDGLALFFASVLAVISFKVLWKSR